MRLREEKQRVKEEVLAEIKEVMKEVQDLSREVAVEQGCREEGVRARLRYICRDAMFKAVAHSKQEWKKVGSTICKEFSNTMFS